MLSPEERRQKILDILRENPKKTQKELSKELDTSELTIKLDYRELKKLGYNLGYKKGASGDKTASKDEKSSEEDLSLPVMHSPKKAIQAIMLLYSIEEEYNNITEIAECGKSTVSRSTIFRSLFPYLKEMGLLKKEGKHWVPSSIFMTSLPKEYSEILNFAAFCLSKNKKDGEEISEQAFNYLGQKSMITRPKQDNMLWNLPFYLQTLEKIKADENPISFEYKGRKVDFFYLGFVAYSSDKDAVYLVGNTRPSKIDNYRVLKANDINWKTVGKGINKNFDDALLDRKKNIRNRLNCFFRKLRAEMFDTVEDKLWPVKIRVDFSMDTDYELRNLYQSRRKQWVNFDDAMAPIRVSEEEKRHSVPRIKYLDAKGNIFDRSVSEASIKYIEYSDNIRGIANFASYLRRFGDSVKVIEDEKLKSIMMDSAIRALEHYKGKGNNDSRKNNS